MSAEPQPKFHVLIKEHGTNVVAKKMNATTHREAELIMHGANINLNHAAYYVQIVFVEEQTSEVAHTEAELHKRWHENANRPHVSVSGDGTVHIILPPEVAKQVMNDLIGSPGLVTGQEDELTTLQLITRWTVNALDAIHGDRWEKQL